MQHQAGCLAGRGGRVSSTGEAALLMVDGCLGGAAEARDRPSLLLPAGGRQGDGPIPTARAQVRTTLSRQCTAPPSPRTGPAR
jgi:hypothetical protein